MSRPTASSFRLGPETDARLARLIEHLELSSTDVIRQAIRRMHDAEFGPKKTLKKTQKKHDTGIATGNTIG